MEIELLINDADRTDLIDVDSLQKESLLNDREDTLLFDIIDVFPDDVLLQENGFELLLETGDGISVGDADLIAVNDEVVLNIDGVKVFGGIITNLKIKTRGDRNRIWGVECSDYTFLLNRVLITERYTDQNAEDIIADLVSQLNTDGSEDFTDTNVVAAVMIKSIGFNRLSVRQCIDKIATLLGYSWYVDYDKDIHFFAVETEAAPFIITDTNGNYLFDSLEYEQDINQIRNVILLEGAEIEGVSRTERYRPVDNQTMFPLANKFANEPTVSVNGLSQTVGVDFLVADTDMSVAWNFNEKYLRFISGLDSTQIVLATGVPLYPLIIQVRDSSSVALYGEYQYNKKDDTVRTREEAIRLANAQLDAYSVPTQKGRFKTYTDGLKSGQILTIQSDLRDINDNFIIERVSMTIDAVDRAVYNVDFASVRSQGIVSVLQSLLTPQELKEGESEQILDFLTLEDTFYVRDEITDITVTTAPYLYDAADARYNMSSWS